MGNLPSFADLSNDQLLAEVKRLAAVERRATASLIRALIELDTRRLYLSEGCASLFTYCTQVLHLAEGAAYNRIDVARVARRFPAVLDALDDGAMTLATIRLLAPHLTSDNFEALLASARYKSKREVERIVAALHPRPAVPTVIRKLPAPSHVLVSPAASSEAKEAVAQAKQLRVEQPESETTSPPPSLSVARSCVTPLAPERYKVQLTISDETHEKLCRARDFLRHSIPTGDVAEIFDRALTALLEQLERRRCAATSSPSARSGTRAPGSRTIPAAVRREVWRRDDGRCAFVGAQGRCTERGFLEFHHVEPFALGGAATVANIQLRCRAHNAYEATQFFWWDAPPGDGGGLD